MDDARGDLLQVVSADAGNEATVFTVTGELDLYTRPVFEDALADCRGLVVMDLRGLTFLDSDGIHAFLTMQRRLSAAGGDLRLVYRPDQHLGRLVRILGLTRMLAPYPDVESALQA